MANNVDNYVNTNAIKQNWAATIGKGGSAIEPTKLYLKINAEMLENGLGGFDASYKNEFRFASGDATTVTVSIGRDNPLVLKPKDQVVTETGFPEASQFNSDRFDLTAQSLGAWFQFTHWTKISDYYNLKSRMPEILMKAYYRMIDTVARDTKVVKGTKKFMPQTADVAGAGEADDGQPADKTNTGYFRWGVILQEIMDINDAGYNTVSPTLYINKATYNYMKFGDTALSEALRRYETTAFINNPRWKENPSQIRTVELDGIMLKITDGYAYTYGAAEDVSNGQKTNLPIQWGTVDGTAYQQENTILDCSILVAGDSCYSLKLIDEMANPKQGSWLVAEPKPNAATDPYGMLGSMAIKSWIGYNVIDPRPVVSFFHRRAPTNIK